MRCAGCGRERVGSAARAVSLIDTLSRFNDAHPWSHNDAFAGFVLRQARAVRRGGGRTAVDVGCGTGNLVARLVAVMPRVNGVEPDPACAATASRRFAATPSVEIQRRAFGGEPEAAYDLIVFVASIHHMPLEPALMSVRSALRPGGRLVIVGLDDATGGGWRSHLSLVLNPIIGFIQHPRRASGTPPHMRAPALPAELSYHDTTEMMRRMLPGVRVRRRLFWRYTAVWRPPR